VTNDERDAKVNELLHDADRAQAGAEFAERIKHLGAHHVQAAKELREKATRLRAEAESIDPERESHWWTEGEEV